MKHGPLNVKIF